MQAQQEQIEEDGKNLASDIKKLIHTKHGILHKKRVKIYSL